MQFRHPNELGGFYWCLNLALSQASCFAAAKLYVDYADVRDGPAEMVELYIGSNVTAGSAAADAEDEEEEGEGFPPSAVMFIIQVAFALWLLSLIGFFASINKDYLHTFFDLASGKQHAARKFRNATTDFEKFAIFTVHKSYCAPVQKEIKAWMNEEYEVFDAEKPEWWTELLISMIPDDFIPKEELKLLKKKGVGGKRKKSVIGLGGRVSFVNGGAGAEQGEGGLTGLAKQLSIRGKGKGGSAATVAPAPTPGS